jgi:hypothetical protein
MTKRRSFRAGRGEYSTSRGPFSAVNDLRSRFMVATFEVEPDLEPTLQTLYNGQLRGNRQWLETPFRGNLAPPSDKAVDLGRSLLKPWCESRGLSDPWCLDWLLVHRLFVWWAGERRQVGLVTGYWAGAPPLEHIPFQLEFDGWDRTEKIRADFETEVRERFEAALSNYCDERESEAEAAGYIRTRERRNPEHFYWLAGYQVCGWSAGRIADALDEPGSRSYESDSPPPTNEERPKRRGVERRIRELAETIGLTLRNSRDYADTQTGQSIRATLIELSRRS